MADINHVVLVGRLTRDAQLKYTNTGIAISTFSVAINRRVKQGDKWTDEAHFFDITLFGKQAEAVTQYLRKGTQVAVEGELRQDRWEQDGQKRSKIVIVANNIQLLGSRPAEMGDKGAQGIEEALPSTENGSAGVFEDDIPF
ncbi:MAG TPA: single-stranded DNA-binding protein [Spirochaetales bacterium]|nr:single-stranded DNA-binding protein [Spirochaetales bacterium]HOV39189.1 single-stranded DNA-binding protein [Spirochaetales bacterium]